MFQVILNSLEAIANQKRGFSTWMLQRQLAHAGPAQHLRAWYIRFRFWLVKSRLDLIILFLLGPVLILSVATNDLTSSQEHLNADWWNFCNKAITVGQDRLTSGLTFLTVLVWCVALVQMSCRMRKSIRWLRRWLRLSVLRFALLLIAFVLSIWIAWPTQAPAEGHQTPTEVTDGDKQTCTVRLNDPCLLTAKDCNMVQPRCAPKTETSKPSPAPTWLERLNQFRANLEPQLAILLLLTSIGTVLVIVSWIFLQDPGVVVLPFEMDGKLDEGNNSGRGISDALVAELNRIRSVHQHPAIQVDFTRRSGGFLDLRPASTDLTDRFSGIGGFNVASSNLQLGALVLVLKGLLPASRRAKTITGSLQRYGDTLSMVARLEGSEVNAFVAIRQISTSNPATTFNLVQDMVAELAAKVATSFKIDDGGRWAALTFKAPDIFKLSQYVGSRIPDHKEVGQRLQSLLQRNGDYTAFELYSWALGQYLRYSTDLDPKQIRFLEESTVIPASSLNELMDSLEPARVLCLWLAESTPQYVNPQRLLCRVGLAYLSLYAIANTNASAIGNAKKNAERDLKRALRKAKRLGRKTPNQKTRSEIEKLKAKTVEATRELDLSKVELGTIQKQETQSLERARMCFKKISNDEVGPLGSLCLGILESRVATTLEDEHFQKSNALKSKVLTEAFAKAKPHFLRATALDPRTLHGWFDLAVANEKIEKYSTKQEVAPEGDYQKLFQNLGTMPTDLRDSLSIGELGIFYNWNGWYLMGQGYKLITEKNAELERLVAIHAAQALVTNAQRDLYFEKEKLKDQIKLKAAREQFVLAAMTDPEDHHSFSNWALVEAAMGNIIVAQTLWRMAYERSHKRATLAVVQLDRIVIGMALVCCQKAKLETQKEQWVSLLSAEANELDGVPTWARMDTYEYLSRLKDVWGFEEVNVIFRKLKQALKG